jgi:hypothetical protein
MKRTSLLGFVGLLASVVAGCPIFGNETSSSQACVGDTCGSGFPAGCHQPSDCLQNETCGADGQCHTGDCTSAGCVGGLSCVVNPDTHTATCQETSSSSSGTGAGGTGGGTSSSSTGTGAGGSKPVYCGHPADCAVGETCTSDGTCKAGDCNANPCIFGYDCQADGTCKSPNAAACDVDADCSAVAGSICIAGHKGGGTCTQPSDQCFDQSQCDSGDKCVGGRCTVGCVANSECRDGFACDTTLKACVKAVKGCTITNDCGSANSVCVGGACVPRSTGGTCTNPDDVWAENGCIPNQAPTFTCVQDGVQDACQASSICLHHSCWISCDPVTMSPCSSQAILNQCKPVTSISGQYNVCGTSQNLGNACDPTANKACTSPGQICVDGFCK